MVVSSLAVFKELLCRIGQEKNGIPHIPKIAEKKNNRYSIPDMPGDVEQMFPREKGNKKLKANTVSGGRNRIRKILDKTRFSILPPKLFRCVGLSWLNSSCSLLELLCIFRHVHAAYFLLLFLFLFKCSKSGS